MRESGYRSQRATSLGDQNAVKGDGEGQGSRGGGAPLYHAGLGLCDDETDAIGDRLIAAGGRSKPCISLHGAPRCPNPPASDWASIEPSHSSSSKQKTATMAQPAPPDWRRLLKGKLLKQSRIEGKLLSPGIAAALAGLLGSLQAPSGPWAARLLPPSPTNPALHVDQAWTWCMQHRSPCNTQPAAAPLPYPPLPACFAVAPLRHERCLEGPLLRVPLCSPSPSPSPRLCRRDDGSNSHPHECVQRWRALGLPPHEHGARRARPGGGAGRGGCCHAPR